MAPLPATLTPSTISVTLSLGVNLAVERTDDGVIADILTEAHIFNRAVYQLFEQIAVIGFRMWTSLVIPLHYLRRRWLRLTSETACSSRPDTDVRLHSQDGQMTQLNLLSMTKRCTQLPATDSAGRGLNLTLHPNQQLAIWVNLSAQYFHIRNVERYLDCLLYTSDAADE